MTNKFFIVTISDRDNTIGYHKNIYKTLSSALTFLTSDIYDLHFNKGVEELFVNIYTEEFDANGALKTREANGAIEYDRLTMLDSSVLENDIMKIAKLLDSIFVDRKYNVQYNIGKVKYVLNTYDGFKEHEDGSEFWDVYTFSNKKKLNEKIKELEKKGYKNRR